MGDEKDTKEQTELEKQIDTIVASRFDEAVSRATEAAVSRFTPAVEVEVVKDETDKLIEANGGYKAFSDFARDIWAAGEGGRRGTERLLAWEAATKTAGHMEEGDMAQGGYLVPVEFAANLQMQALELSIVKPLATRVPMQTNRVEMPAIRDATHATGTTFGGITIYRPAELAQKDPSKPKLGKVALQLHELVGLVYVSNQLLEDSPISLEPLLGSMFAQAIAFVEDDDYLLGNGANRALGAFNAVNPCLVAQAKEVGQLAATIVFQNIIKMWARMHPMCHRNAVWVANIDCFEQMASMNMAVGTGGVPVWMPAQGVAGAPNGTLMGRPLHLSEKMQTVGTQADIGLADFSQYFVGDKGGVRTAQSMHLRFDYNEMAFRFEMRYDGQPAWLTSLTPRRGANTLSPFVVLQVRA